MRVSLALLVLSALVGCNGDTGDFSGSAATDPTVDFGLEPPEVDTDRPIDPCTDADGDGYGDGCDRGVDCNDDDPEISPAELEVAYDGIDNDCDATTPDDDIDEDGAVLEDDCDDENPDVGPNSPELCENGIDDDCDESTPDDQERGVASCPYELTGPSCKAVLSANPSQADVDGYYDLEFGTAYCDMTTDGGGWTLAMVVSDDGEDNFDWAGSGLLSTRSKRIGDVFNLDKDFRSPYWFDSDVLMSDLLFHHEPSGVWAAYSVGDDSESASRTVNQFGPPLSSNCYDPEADVFPPADIGFEMIAGTLATDDAVDGRELCDTKLYFNLGDHESLDQDVCLGATGELEDRQGTFGPTWNSAELAEGTCDTHPFNDPATAALGPDESDPDVEQPSLGFAGPLGLNTGAAGTGENHMKIFVR